MEKDIHENGNRKKVEVAILRSDKVEFKPKSAIRSKESRIIRKGQSKKRI